MTDVHEAYTRYAPVVFRRCRSILGSEDDAWDGVQEVFLRWTERPRRLESLDSPTAYFWRAATNYCLNRIKKEGRVVPLLEFEGEDPRSHADEGLRTLFLDKLFDQVPARTRELAWYRWVDGLTWEETALASGLSVSGVRKHLAKFSAFAGRYKEHVG